jgi:hypothetical protein
MRIRQRAFERVILTRQGLAKLRDARREHLEAARVVRGELRLAANQIQRGSPLRAGLRQNQRQVRKIECRETDLAGDFRAGLKRPEAAGDHQVNHQEQLAFERPHEALAQAAKPDHDLAVRLIDGRIERPHEKRTRDANPFEPVVENARCERVKVKLDVRKFRHCYCALISAPQPVGRGAPSRSARSARATPSARGLQAPVRRKVNASAYEDSAGSPSGCVMSSGAPQSAGMPSKKSPSWFTFFNENATGTSTLSQKLKAYCPTGFP